MGTGEKVVATNRKARHEYHIDERIEAGLVLTGTEVKSLRSGKVSLQDAYCSAMDGELMLMQCHIPPYAFGNIQNHDPVRPRKLLLHRREIDRWSRASQQKGYTIVPLRLYFSKGFAKLEIALARGKKLYDKRADIAARDSKRRIERLDSRRSRD